MSETVTNGKRRTFLWGAMFTALAAAYGTLTSYLLGFIFPLRREGPPQRLFIGFTRKIDIGASKSVRPASGDQLIVSNTGKIDPETGSPLIGFSNQCPLANKPSTHTVAFADGACRREDAYSSRSSTRPSRRT